MQILNVQEIEEVSGAVDWGMVGTGALLVVAGSLAVATGGFSLIAVGNIALAGGAAWGGVGLSL
ncbi:MAG: hypothetical protein K2Y13_04730 [Burkholderiaceae bacterium]|nr:hypothetical protein [Burkholderiaceae bacterium]